MNRDRSERRGEATAFPRVQRPDAATLYLEAGAGVVFRVHDCIFRNGRPRRLALGSPSATHRYFVSAQRERRVVGLGRGMAERALTAEHLARQLQAAAYVATSRFDPSNHGAR